MSTAGKLYLVPVGLGGQNPATTHPPDVLKLLAGLRHFIVERAKTARADLKLLGHPGPLQSLVIDELPESPDTGWIDARLAPALNGASIGLMSEAGCPAVADPGALVVRRAHELGIQVVPLVGPSSILLALMASGLNGQSFAFHGYLPIEADKRRARIQTLETESAQWARTQLFIETPYRNSAMLDALLASCQPSSMLCVAAALTAPGELILSRTIETWRHSEHPALDRMPTMFLLLASAKLRPQRHG